MSLAQAKQAQERRFKTALIRSGLGRDGVLSPVPSIDSARGGPRMKSIAVKAFGRHLKGADASVPFSFGGFFGNSGKPSGGFPIGSIDNAGDLLEALYRKMSGDTIELSVKGGELVSSEPTGCAGEMEDHTVKLVNKDFVNIIESLDGKELDKFLLDNGFDKNNVLDDVVVALAEKQGHLQDIVPAICKVYGWKAGVEESQEAVESLDEIYDAKSAEAEFGQEDHAEISGEQVRG